MSSTINAYMADFETTTDPEDCHVWLWELQDIFSGVYYQGLSIQSFVEMACELPNNSQVYFHNLGFDGSFILDWLLRNGFHHREGRDALRKRNFHSLISSADKFYSMTVRFDNGTRIEFRDSLKKIPLSVYHTAKAFQLEEAKGVIDYDAPRPVGYKPTREERGYVHMDVTIMAKALKVQLEEGMTRLTIGADSLAEYKELFGGKKFKLLFPVLPMSMDAEIRKAYRGGWTYADTRFSRQIVGHGRSYDVNSLYPSVMYNRLLPYGEPIFRDGPPIVQEGYPLFITSITFTARLKPDHVPCIQVKNNIHFMAAMYQEVIEDPVTIACTNIDLALWQEQYDLDILSYNGTWYFHGAHGMFNDYIDKWSEIKANSEGGMRLIAKLHLNSLYGKFATNPDVTPKIPYLNEKGIVALRMGDYEERQPVYTAMGVFITAYARDITIRAAQDNYAIFAYADTDSLHLLTDTDPDMLDIDPVRLGAWKHELTFSRAIYIRAKCYTEEAAEKWWCLTCEAKGKKSDDSRLMHTTATGHQTSDLVTHIAGLPERIAEQVTFDDYTNGRGFDGKLLPKRVKGGIVLEQTRFTLNL